MKNFKQIISVLLALVMMLSLVACTKTPATSTTAGKTDDTTAAPDTTVSDEPVTYVDPYADLADDYDALSSAVYEDVLGDFYAVYEAAKENSTSVSERFALMAIAEAKLLESGVFLPLTSKGGNYAISRVVPNTVTSTLWGNDTERQHSLLVATEPITAADRAELKAMWAELKGSGTWLEKAKAYMADKGYTLKDSYSQGYTSDPETWDVLNTSKAADSEAIVKTYDGLAEYDTENVLQPALAESWSVSDDGLTYTFKIRQGVKWVDSQGREVADVTADDFVAGMQHMMDACGGLEYLVQGIIVNANEYISGAVTDFSKVGVKAVDDYTLQYTLVQPTSYFLTMLGYGVFAPMSRSFYESKGGKFGEEFDAAAETYTYGKTPDDIAYCGPYLVSNATAENTIVFKANPAYWNAKNVTVQTITWLYNDGKDALKAYNDTMSGVLDGAGLNSSAVEAAKNDGVFDTLAYSTATDATCFSAFLNVNRIATANTNDNTTAASTKDELAQERSKAALRNQHFRLAMNLAVDRGAYNAQTVGEELKYASLINSFTPGTFVTLEEDVTVDINGTATTFPAGTNYGAIVQAQLDADGMTIKAWDPTADDGVGSSAGYDGWYNPDEAVKELNTAIEELKAIGIEVSAENPIYIDYPYPSSNEAYANRANAYKQNIEAVLGGSVIVNLVDTVDNKGWNYAGYLTTYGNEANYDMYDLSGWGPDYGDPASYLDTMLPDYAGYMVKCIGLF